MHVVNIHDFVTKAANKKRFSSNNLPTDLPLPSHRIFSLYDLRSKGTRNPIQRMRAHIMGGCGSVGLYGHQRVAGLNPSSD